MLLSYLITLAGLLAFSLPVAGALILARRFLPRHRLTVSGVVLGVVAAPFSVFLYMQFFTDPIRALLLGFPGLILMTIHLSPFMSPSAASHEIVTSPFAGAVGLVRGLPLTAPLVWSVVYGLVGAAADRNRRRKLPSRPAA